MFLPYLNTLLRIHISGNVISAVSHVSFEWVLFILILSFFITNQLVRPQLSKLLYVHHCRTYSLSSRVKWYIPRQATSLCPAHILLLNLPSKPSPVIFVDILPNSPGDSFHPTPFLKAHTLSHPDSVVAGIPCDPHPLLSFHFPPHR